MPRSRERSSRLAAAQTCRGAGCAVPVMQHRVALTHWVHTAWGFHCSHTHPGAHPGLPPSIPSPLTQIRVCRARDPGWDTEPAPTASFSQGEADLGHSGASQADLALWLLLPNRYKVRGTFLKALKLFYHKLQILKQKSPQNPKFSAVMR